MNKKGLSSIFLAIYLLFLLFVLAGIMFGAVRITAAFAKQQEASFQEDYYLERGIYYAVNYIRRDTSNDLGETWNAWPNAAEGADIVMSGAENPTANPPYNTYTITSSTPTTAPASRPRKTATAVYENGKILSYIISS